MVSLHLMNKRHFLLKIFFLRQNWTLNDGPRELPTLPAVQATWDVIALEPPEPQMTQHTFQKAKKHAKICTVLQHPQAHPDTIRQRTPTEC